MIAKVRRREMGSASFESSSVALGVGAFIFSGRSLQGAWRALSSARRLSPICARWREGARRRPAIVKSTRDYYWRRPAGYGRWRSPPSSDRKSRCEWPASPQRKPRRWWSLRRGSLRRSAWKRTHTSPKPPVCCRTRSDAARRPDIARPSGRRAASRDHTG